MTPYLYLHQNRHAPLRANNRRFHGYPTRPAAPRLIGLHTTESLFDLLGEDSGAESVARFQSTTDRPSSYHRIVDRDSTVVCLPDEAVAFGIGNLNSPTLHLSLAMRAAEWSDPAKARAARPMLERAADVAAEWCTAYGIPLTELTRDQAFGTSRGFVRHGTDDPGRRSDPGADFPADLFFELIADRLAAPTVQEDDVMYQLLETTDTKRLYALSSARLDHIETMEPLVGLARVGAFRALDSAGNPTSGQFTQSDVDGQVTQSDVDQAAAVLA